MRILLALLVAAALAVPAQAQRRDGRDDRGRRDGRNDPCENLLPLPPREEVSGEGYRVTYEPDPARKSLFRIVAPEGAGVRVTDGSKELLRDTIPATFEAEAAHFYRVEVFTNERVFFDKKLEARRDATASVAVASPMRPPPPPPPPVVPQPQPQPAVLPTPMPVTPQPNPAVLPAPQPVPQPAPVVACMAPQEAKAIEREIKGAPFSNAKLQVLGTAMNGRRVCVGQVIDILNLFPFSGDKMNALRTMAPLIVDRNNNFKIYGALRFQSEKDQARQILDGR